ncbi:MAG: hypothetical protein U0R50_12905 [Gaiellales bacterium]
MSTFRAGAASLPLTPPLDLPMIGFVRQRLPAQGYGLPLETTAIAFEREGARVVLCGVDIVGITSPQVESLIERVAAATGAAPEGVLLNWSHTHLAPTGGRLGGDVFGELPEARRQSMDAFARVIQDKVVSVCALASQRLEPARVVWGQADVDLAVNRRERVEGGSILGWNPDELVDTQATVLQARRPDESVIATLVGYGCHPVTTGHDLFVYSADFPGAMREAVRGLTGGECTFFQGAGGNVLPRFSFNADEAEARRVGTCLAVAAVESVADQYATPIEIAVHSDQSANIYSVYRPRQVEAPAPALGATMTQVTIPLMPHPSLDEVAALRDQYDRDLEDARSAGDHGRIKVAHYHAAWAHKIEAQLRDGTAPTFVTGRVNAVRIGDGAIVTGPGETFTEYGMAVKERSPATPTLYAGYTNGLLGYLPTANEYQHKGYEAGYGYKSAGLPSLFDPSVERILVEAAVRATEELFPGCKPWVEPGAWTASGALPRLEKRALVHPSRVAEHAR